MRQQDPTLAAALPLIGVALGALLGGLARWQLDRASERRASAASLAAAARVVFDDIWWMRQVLDAVDALDGLRNDVHRERLTSSAWEEVRLRLASDYAAWNATRSAIIAVELVVDVSRQQNQTASLGLYTLFDVRRVAALDALHDASAHLSRLGADQPPRRHPLLSRLRRSHKSQPPAENSSSSP